MTKFRRCEAIIFASQCKQNLVLLICGIVNLITDKMKSFKNSQNINLITDGTRNCILHLYFRLEYRLRVKEKTCEIQSLIGKHFQNLRHALKVRFNYILQKYLFLILIVCSMFNNISNTES